MKDEQKKRAEAAKPARSRKLPEGKGREGKGRFVG
jgi:hypothetical protein